MSGEISIGTEVLILGPMRHAVLVRPDKESIGRAKGNDLTGADLIGKTGVVIAPHPASASHPDPFFFVKIGNEKLSLRRSEIVAYGK